MEKLARFSLLMVFIAGLALIFGVLVVQLYKAG